MTLLARDAANAARGFLAGAQAADGSWKDFLLPAGSSNIWVTAFVAGALGEGDAARRAWRFLESAAKPEGGWSYNAIVPADADSTLWALRLAEQLGESSSDAAVRGRAALEAHFREDGGIATYASAGPIRAYIGLPSIVPFDGWTASHVCVSAACANLPPFRDRLQSYLETQRRDDGTWRAYWWFDDEFATAEAVAALGADASVTAWACERVERAETPFALAHALRIAARGGAGDAVIGRAVERLVSTQKSDGSFPPSARLRVPRPDARVPDPAADWTMWAGMPPGPASMDNVLRYTFNNYSPDHFGVYTTATVLMALREATA